jgi:NAD(P)-dependent dehydrogenase (short-subunit alcohol dehydrogenase family)
MGKLDGKVAIVTGGSAGIGRGIAGAFALEGAAIAICARRSEKLRVAKADLESLGARVFAMTCDVSEKDAVKEFVKAVGGHFGRIDILVNNACSMPSPRPLDEVTEEGWELPIKSGLYASFRFMQACFPYLKVRGGKIINLSSAAGSRGVPGNGGYSAAKSGIDGLTRVAAMDWAAHKINVNAISPFAMSEAWADHVKTLPVEVQSDPISAVGLRPPPIGWLGDAQQHIGAAALFLACADSDYITGHILPVDGGSINLGV